MGSFPAMVRREGRRDLGSGEVGSGCGVRLDLAGREAEANSAW